jgi:lipid-binding SYLF domain-containing protein
MKKKGNVEKFRIVLRLTVLSLSLVIMAGVPVESASIKTTQEIDASVKACLDRFYKQVKGGKEIAAKAKGVLVMPNVVKAGFIVGGEYGEGAMRIGGKTVSYYNIASGSLGMQIGGESRDFVILFMTDEVLKQFQASQGWEAGLDGNVALVTMGAGDRADLTRMYDPIIAFVFDVKGLMADISLRGAKFTKITPK